MANNNKYGAVQLDGSTYAQAASVSHNNFGTGDFSVDIAFTTSSTTGTHLLIGKWSANVGWKVELVNGTLVVTFNATTYNVVTNVHDNAVHRLLLTVSRTASKAYVFIDGSLDGNITITSATVSNLASLYVGGDGVNNWSGTIAEVRLSNKCRQTLAYTADVRQFVDDNWTVALYHRSQDT